MTDYNLIDRITAIRLELENETSNIYRILLAVRNILHQADNMSYSSIRTILMTYYCLYPIEGININIINLITSPNANINSSINTLLLNQQHTNNNQQHTNNNQQHTNNNQQHPNNSILDSDDEDEYDDEDDDDENDDDIYTDDTDDLESLSSDNNDNNAPEIPYINAPEIPYTNAQLSQSFFFIPTNDELNNPSYEYIRTLFSGTQPVTNITPTYNTMFNSMLSLSNSLDMNLNDIEATDNLFNRFNVPPSENVDIPVVITNESFNKLRRCKYLELDNELKNKNIKCMITLETLEDDNEIMVLPCNHVFLEEEITDWLKNNSYKCPSCRYPSGNYYAKI